MRCKLSELGKRELSSMKYPNREGEIVREDSGEGSVMVVWDGTKTAKGYASKFIEIIQR